MAARDHAPPQNSGREWFDEPAGDDARPGLRFACTMCGNCCTGPPGYVLISDEEIARVADHLRMSPEVFTARYTHTTRAGVSLTEVAGPAGGWDCVFLDRASHPGRAVCGVYEARPAQCRAWPFWPRNLENEEAWRRASRTCPGIGRGPLHSPDVIRLTRDGTHV